eukprot:3836868-Pyramimonas_sp.AAC.1
MSRGVVWPWSRRRVHIGAGLSKTAWWPRKCYEPVVAGVGELYPLLHVASASVPTREYQIPWLEIPVGLGVGERSGLASRGAVASIGNSPVPSWSLTYRGGMSVL